ncbi:HTH domain protein [Caulifigura coniformis]|uniref:HTH domain protein n=1 Tax=Caulifigura coniformis TaxID=2527983 RepID=A0A517SAH5_9PLAN|nr:WYL domain-containing protein [Caulifigura coniformis]QDT53131.1 HTH domain protein [Caulifigura coniformis]
MGSTDKIRRILTLVERLQSGRLYNAPELADFCNVSHRTIFRDLKVLQQSGVPVLYDDERRGYFMPAASFLPPTDLTLQEALALIILTQELGDRDKGIPFQEAARSASLKFLSNIAGQLKSYLGDVASAVHVRMERRHKLDRARPHFELLQQSVAEKRKVRLRYNSLYDGREIGLLLSPYAMFFSRRSWYAIGRSSLYRSIRTFHVGRILESTLTDDSFKPPPRFSVARYLGNAWHMIREPEQRADIVVRFQPRVATNVAEVTWHPTQRIVHRGDGTVDFCVTVEGIREIAWWILGYGDQAEVIKPRELRQLVAQHVRGMASIYRMDDGAAHRTRKRAR